MPTTISTHKDKIIRMFNDGVFIAEISRRTQFKANTLRFNLKKWGVLKPKAIKTYKRKPKEMPDFVDARYFINNPIF